MNVIWNEAGPQLQLVHNLEIGEMVCHLTGQDERKGKKMKDRSLQNHKITFSKLPV